MSANNFYSGKISMAETGGGPDWLRAAPFEAERQRLLETKDQAGAEIE